MASVCFEIQERTVAHGDDAGMRIDGEATTGIVAEGKSYSRAVRISRGGGDPDGSAIGGTFGHAVGARVAVGRDGRTDVRHADRENAGSGEVAVAGSNGGPRRGKGARG